VKQRKTLGKRNSDGSRRAGQAARNLAGRIASYESTIATNSSDAKAFRKPGRAY
jgi:hypothetical protein